jgi:hypothetical protein
MLPDGDVWLCACVCACDTGVWGQFVLRVCVCVCVCACARACVHAVCVCKCASQLKPNTWGGTHIVKEKFLGGYGVCHGCTPCS